MKELLKLSVSLARPNGDTDVVLVLQDPSGKLSVIPNTPYTDTLERLKKSGGATGAAKTTHMLRFCGQAGVESVLFVGLGKVQDLTPEKARLAGAACWNKISAEKIKSAQVRWDLATKLKGLSRSKSSASSLESLARAFGEGMLMASYQFHGYKKDKPDDTGDVGVKEIEFAVLAKDKARFKKVVEETQAASEAIALCRDWSNEPSNIGTPEHYAAQASALAKKHGLKCTVLTEAQLSKEGMGLLLGVGQGSEREGRLVIVEHAPKKSSKTLALVGKGVTFDSGGISIKPALNMEDMVHDMTGAATVMAATVLASKLGSPHHVVAVMAFTENMPSGTAIQPGNILTSRSGKTVEIINTDAEGRLVLGDALDYVQDVFKPEVVIDVATLTGAVSVALGKHCCGVLGNDDGVISALRDLGDELHERSWQLPLFDEYFEDMKSEFADMKNSANNPLGGTIRGAIFLKQFIKPGVRWAHLDIANTAYDMGHLGYCPKHGASGLHVRTLARFVCEY